MKHIAYVFMLATWIAGVVLARGFWLTTLAIFFPFYAWYLLAERAMTMLGLI